MRMTQQRWQRAKRFFQRLGRYYHQGVEEVMEFLAADKPRIADFINNASMEQLPVRPENTHPRHSKASIETRPHIIGLVWGIDPHHPSPKKTSRLSTRNGHSTSSGSRASPRTGDEADTLKTSPLTEANPTADTTSTLSKPCQVFELEALGPGVASGRLLARWEDEAQLSNDLTARSGEYRRTEQQWRKLTVGTSTWQSLSAELAKELEGINKN